MNHQTPQLTKSDLQETLKDYPTKQDLHNALKDYPTKQDLHNEIAITHEVMEIKLKEQSNSIFEKLDYLIKQFEEMREDRELKTYHDANTAKTLQNHDKRIKKLEQTIQKA